jgi:hypothetical protein
MRCIKRECTYIQIFTKKTLCMTKFGFLPVKVADGHCDEKLPCLHEKP